MSKPQIMEPDATLVDKMKEKMEDLKILMSVPRTLRKFVSEHFLWGFGICLRSRRCLIPGDAISVEHFRETKTNGMRFSTEPNFCNF